MVWQEKACCIVMLTKTFDFIKVSFYLIQNQIFSSKSEQADKETHIKFSTCNQGCQIISIKTW